MCLLCFLSPQHPDAVSMGARSLCSTFCVHSEPPYSRSPAESSPGRFPVSLKQKVEPNPDVPELIYKCMNASIRTECTDTTV